jgi:predicted Zn finger-like uncharacterized protein
MDVRCSRCSTEYDFDDALISERGTTVKCTSCSFQFKVYPPETAGKTPERWLVRTEAGREIVYTSLGDLQRGIAQQAIGPNDFLSRGPKRPRRLGSIAELEPFFNPAASKLAEQVQRTLPGVAPSANALRDSAPPLPKTPKTAALAQAPADTDKTPVPGASAPSVAASSISDAVASAVSTAASHAAEIPKSRPSNAEGLPVPPSWNWKSGEEYAPESEPQPKVVVDPSRRAKSRWIAGVVLLSMLSLLAATVGRKYLDRFAPRTPEARPTSDARVAGFLTEGNRLLREGDFDSAREAFSKADALADKDPAVLSALAELETESADVAWLKLLLLDPKSIDLVQATRRDLARGVARSRTAVERALAVAPQDPVALRARVDALRLASEPSQARASLGAIAANASLPENAYLLAALDLGEQAPVWSSVIDRLRAAASAEGEYGRARAALIYALSRAGMAAEAESEFAKIEARAKPHPLLEELRSFLARANGGSAAISAAKSRDLPVEPSTPPAMGGSPNISESAPGATKSDFRTRLAQAAVAFGRGDMASAEELYASVLAEQPSNTEALSGLGDVARKRNDLASAAKYYDRVLTQNPSYLPALVASADQKWDSGDRAAALVLYRRVLEQGGPETAYGARARARIAEAEALPAKPAASAQRPAPAPTPSSDTPAPAPSIDTTDLPGFK